MLLKFFPILAPAAAILGFLMPNEIASLKSSIVPLLMVIMLCMGLTLKPQDFIEVKKYKNAVFVGMLLQFTVMPFTALGLSLLFGLSQELTLGLVLLGSVAGGVSSNVMTYIARGHVAMSVSMTALSTLMSVVMTPLMLVLLMGSKVDLPTESMLISLLKIILLPVSLGMFINYFGHKGIKKIEPALPILSMMVILLVIAIVVAVNFDRLADTAFLVVIATLLHNLTGMTLGYLAAALLGFNKKVCRTIAIEVGMQNSALAAALALKFFSPIAALPGAIFSIWLNITGSIFASVSLYLDDDDGDEASDPDDSQTSPQVL